MFSNPDASVYESGEYVPLVSAPIERTVPDNTSSASYVDAGGSGDKFGTVDVSDLDDYENLTGTLYFQLVGVCDPNGATGGMDLKVKVAGEGEDAVPTYNVTGTGNTAFSTPRNAFNPSSDVARYKVQIRSGDGSTTVHSRGSPYLIVWGQVA